MKTTHTHEHTHETETDKDMQALIAHLWQLRAERIASTVGVLISAGMPLQDAYQLAATDYDHNGYWYNPSEPIERSPKYFNKLAKKQSFEEIAEEEYKRINHAELFPRF